MTTTEIIYNILGRHHELTVGAIFKKCEGIKSIGNQKTVSNALTRLKSQGRVQSEYDQDRGIWLWNIVRNGSPIASPGCDLTEMGLPQSPADHPEDDLEMASDVAELEQPQSVVNDSLTTEAVTEEFSATDKESLTVTGTATESRTKTRKPYTPNKIAGAYAYRGALVIKLDRKAHAKSITLSAKDMAMLTSIYGNMA